MNANNLQSLREAAQNAIRPKLPDEPMIDFIKGQVERLQFFHAVANPLAVMQLLDEIDELRVSR